TASCARSAAAIRRRRGGCRRLWGGSWIARLPVSRTRCSASSAVHRRAGTHHAGPRLATDSWVPGLQRIIPQTLHAAQRTGHDLSCFRLLAARFRPSDANSYVLTLETEGAGNAGCALHPRSRVPRIAHLAHTSIQGSGNTPTSP